MKLRLSQPKMVHAAALLSATIVACTPAVAPVPCPLQVTVNTEAGVPLRGATLRVNERDIGSTNATGELHFTSMAPEGSVLTLSVRCPSGFESVGAPIAVAVRRLTALAGSHAPPSLRQRLVCHSTAQTSVVVVSADQPDLPVLIDGSALATTNEDGIAHVSVRGKPEASFEIALDTTAHPELRPQNPSRHFTLGKAAQIFKFLQPLKSEKPHPRRTAKKPERSVPYRID
jgi:hypothetical protein